MFCPHNVGINMLFYYNSSTIFYTVYIITMIIEKSGVTFLCLFFSFSENAHILLRVLSLDGMMMKCAVGWC